MKTGVVDQMTTAMSTIATPRRDCMVRGEEGAWDEVPGSKDADICFAFSTRSVPLPRVKRGGIQFMREIPLKGVMSIVLQRNVLLWYANVSIAVARPARNSQIRSEDGPFEETGWPCSVAGKGDRNGSPSPYINERRLCCENGKGEVNSTVF